MMIIETYKYYYLLLYSMGKKIIYPLKIDDELWEKFKTTFPRNKTPTAILTEIIEEKIKEANGNKNKGGK